ncbi:molybdate ABC transporter substrate-binding protein [Methyloradius palustris]|uniref:Molybdate ABC transporter substrate-binding protein n=1 Tax=Methyloradius palustris TaxID=2778876 RepID=A0A8D5K1N0_9PROT|nr:molybdate ABC transporter substrate-binding protein [Methyloradius palustris]BCM25918.1 molybdate ABC transporter substrate-binding protein [Methyloradius palustris]
MFKKISIWMSGLLLASLVFSANADDKVTIFAAASLTNVITELGAQYEKEQSVKVVNSFAASSALAKQIENGAPADVFMSADSKWMNYLQDKNLIDVSSRINLLGNRLVLIAPKGRSFKVDFKKTFDFAKAFDGRLCTGDIDAVPVGIYAKQSFNNLGWWDGIKTRIVGAQDVRAALAFVERGECGAGVVYETDAKVSDKVEIVGVFPDETHDAIVYPLAIVSKTSGVNPLAKPFAAYLASPKAAEVFSKYGFTVLTK